jgi:adenylate cyclase
MLTWTAWKSGGFVLLGVSTFLVGGLWAIDVAWLFRQLHAETTLLPVMLQIGLSAFTLLLFKTAIESARTKTIRATFSRYVAPSVVELLTSEGRQVELGGEKRELTAFFSDIRQFTSLSEFLDPARLVEMLNSYFEPMTEVIFTNGGTLDKFLGDGIFWSARSSRRSCRESGPLRAGVLGSFAWCE